MKKPGFMVYFDTATSLRILEDADCGRMFKAMADYAESGTVPNLEDPKLQAIWPFIRPRLDADSLRYADRTASGKYAVYARKAKAAGVTPIAFEDWKNLTEAEQEHIMVDQSLTTVDQSLTINDQIHKAKNKKQITNNRKQITNNNPMGGADKPPRARVDCKSNFRFARFTSGYGKVLQD